MDIELPAYEDIYDFNENDLNYYQKRISEVLKVKEGLTEKFVRKGLRILELIQIELEERIAVNQITSFCSKEIDSELYKEVFSEEGEQGSTDVRDSESLSQDTVETFETKEESVSEKMWNMRKTKKNYKDFVRSTLKNTQQGVGLVIGSSSVPVKPKIVEEKPKTEPKKPPAKQPEVKKTIEKPQTKNEVKEKHDRPQARSQAKPEDKTLKKPTQPKLVDEKSVKKSESLKPGQSKTQITSNTTEKPLASKKPNIKESPIEKKSNLRPAEGQESKPTALNPLEYPQTPNKIADSQEDLTSINETSKPQPDPESLAHQLSPSIPHHHPLPNLIPSLPDSSSPGQIVPEASGLQASVSPPSLFKINEDSPQSSSKSSPRASSPLSSPSSSAGPNLVHPIKRTQQLELSDNKVADQPDSHFVQRNLEGVSDGFGSDKTKDSNFGLALGDEVKVRDLKDPNGGRIYEEDENDEKNEKNEKNADLNENSKGLHELSKEASEESGSSLDDDKDKNPEKSDIVPELKHKKQAAQPYTRKTEPSFENYKPDEAGLADLKALKQKILASKLRHPEQVTELKAEIVENDKTEKIDKIEKVEETKSEAPKATPTKAKVPVKPKKPENTTDYSAYYSSFFDIFAGNSVSKDFNSLQTLRDCLTTFKEFVTLIDSPEFEVHKKFKLTLAPLEINPRDLVRGEESFPVFPCEKEMYYRVVKARPEVYDIVSRGLNKKKAWSELPHGMNLRMSWNLMWTWSKPSLDFSKLLVWQQVNHFPETKNFSRKDMLKRNIEKTMKISAKAGNLWNIIPVTYVLPKEYVTFVDHYGQLEKTEPDTNVWIMKPVGKSRGRGISVINDVNQVSYGEVMVIQRYISNPLLLEGYKFDLRLYILITKFQPLEAFIYKEGFARMSTVPFSMNPDKLQNKFIHLTNSSIQKYNHSKGESLDSILGGTKICLKTLIERLIKTGVNWDKIWSQIIELVLKSLIAVQSEIPSYNCCFDLVGYDVMIDQNMQTWLVEINSSPSLARENYLDDLIKQQLIDDTLELVNPIYFNKQELVKVLERRVSEVQKGHVNNTVAQLNTDLNKVLDGKKPRKYGEVPEKMGNFEMISPSGLYDRLYKIANPRS